MIAGMDPRTEALQEQARRSAVMAAKPNRKVPYDDQPPGLVGHNDEHPRPKAGGST